MMEMAAVLALVAFMALTAAPTMHQLGQMRESAGAERIAADLRYARNYAAASRLRTWAAFDVGAQQCTLYVEDPASPGKANRLTMTHPLHLGPFVHNLGTGDWQAVTLAGVDFRGKTEVEFDNYGQPYDGDAVPLTADGTVTLTGSRQIVVSAVSGMVKVQ